tara:strand:+ start:3586 stop:3786 length:201 start_codon:yes stop_codon:yes gene_type:complete
MNNEETPLALKYLRTRRHQIIDQMSRLIDVSPKHLWDERAKRELDNLQKAYKDTVGEILLLESLKY